MRAEETSKALIPNPAGIADKKSCVQNLTAFSNTMLSCTHGFEGDFGKQNSIKVIDKTISLHMHSVGHVVNLGTLGNLRQGFLNNYFKYNSK